MHLVVDRQDRAVVIDHIDRVVGAQHAGRRRHAGRARGAGDQHRARRQQVGDLRHRVGFARQEERKRRFRPDQMRDVAHAGRSADRSRGRTARDSAPSPAACARVVELLVLRQVRLHDAQLHAVDELRRRSRKPHRAVAGQARRATASGDQHGAATAAAYRGARRRAPPGSRTAQTAKNVSPHRADQRRSLRQHQRPGQRIAERIPGKAGEHDGRAAIRRPSARPRAPGCAAVRASITARASANAERGEERQTRRQRRSPRTAAARRTSWRRPGRRGRSSRGRRRNSRSRTTSRRSPRAITPPSRPAGRAVDQPDRDREGEEQHRPGVERRERQRRDGARDERDRGAPPAPGQHHRMATSTRHAARLPAGSRLGSCRAARGIVVPCAAARRRAAALGAVRRPALAARDADLLHPARIGVEHLDLEVARARHDLAAHGNAGRPAS